MARARGTAGGRVRWRTPRWRRSRRGRGSAGPGRTLDRNQLADSSTNTARPGSTSARTVRVPGRAQRVHQQGEIARHLAGAEQLARGGRAAQAFARDQAHGALHAVSRSTWAAVNSRRLPCRFVLRVEQWDELVAEAREGFSHQRLVERPLGAVMVKTVALLTPAAARDLRHRGAGVTPVGEQPPGGAFDAPGTRGRGTWRGRDGSSTDPITDRSVGQLSANSRIAPASLRRTL